MKITLLCSVSLNFMVKVFVHFLYIFSLLFTGYIFDFSVKFGNKEMGEYFLHCFREDAEQISPL